MYQFLVRDMPDYFQRGILENGQKFLSEMLCNIPPKIRIVIENNWLSG